MVELVIEALAAGGDGVAREASGRVVMIGRTAPGDRVRVELVEEHARWARGELVEVLAPGAARVAPRCPVVDRCGGCQWQQVDLAAQREAKQALAAGTLRRLIASGMELRPLAAPVDGWHWRRRARLHWERGAELSLGFAARRSRSVVDVDDCPQLDQRLAALLAPLHQALGDGLGERGQLHLAVGTAGQVHVVIEGPCRRDAAQRAAGLPGVVGVVVRHQGDHVLGAGAIELEPDQWCAADGFAQASFDGNQALRREVTRALGAGAGRLLELYAGAGNFTRDAIAAGWTVVASDQVAAEPVPVGASWRTGPAATVVDELLAQKERFDAVLLDPPRVGARDVCRRLAGLGARRVVYVSCDLPTLARDGETLAADGLVARYAQPIDLMPQTAHVETVAVFARDS